MNVIIANKRKDELSNIDVEVIKRLDGEFDVEEIISSFQNFFYNKMILDITALKNYKDLKTIQKLSISLSMDKLILLLDEEPKSISMPMPSYLSKLISLGIYNFTTNVEGILYLYNNPNSYKDVAQYHILDDPEPEIKTIIKTVEVEQPAFSTYSQVPQRQIIGLKNVTPGAGATTLAYLLKKASENYCDSLAVEIDKRDFIYFKDKGLVSTTSSQLNNILSDNIDKKVVFIDTNGNQVVENSCTQIIYLLEPSIIKLNKLISTRPGILTTLKNKKIILNKCCLDSKDVKEFSFESNLDIFFTIPNLDDRKNNSILDDLLRKLNLI